MPRAVSLAPYAVRVWNLQEKQDEQVSDFDQKTDLYEVFHAFFSGLKQKTALNKETQQVLAVRKLRQEKSNRWLYGVLETGEYGVESTLWDVQNHKVAHSRTTNEAEMLPFYFLVYVPQGPKSAVMLLQRLGMFGIRSALSRAINRHSR